MISYICVLCHAQHHLQEDHNHLCHSLTQEGHVMREKYAEVIIVGLGPTIFSRGFNSFTFLSLS